MQTRGSLVANAAAKLSAAGVAEPRRQARRLVADALAISSAELFGHPERPVGDEQTSRVRSMLSRAISGEPLSRILGKREFWGMGFGLSPDTLDPRPETETVVEAVLRRNIKRDASLRFLDLGTGTGCLLLALLAEFPLGTGVGIDIAEGAVRTAIRNSASLGLADRVHFLVADWADPVRGTFDVILSNPPYVATEALPLLPREVASHDPKRALDGGEDGLRFYRRIAEVGAKLVCNDGMIAVEVGADQAEAVAAILNLYELHVEAVEKDLAGIPRCVIARRAPYGR